MVQNETPWGDIDNNGTMDVACPGIFPLRVYDGTAFNTYTQIPLANYALYYGSGAWDDYDNDGFPDILLTGATNTEYLNNNPVSKIYHNKGDVSFTELTGFEIIGVYSSSVAYGDYDSYGDLDLLLSGVYATDNVFTRIYMNNAIMRASTILPNSPPGTPAYLTSTINPHAVNLSWMPVTKDETPSISISYNLRYRPAADTIWRGAPQSANNGYRRIVSLGNIGLNNGFSFTDLTEGAYTWQVQAVDQGYAGGEWSAVDSFVVKNVQAFFTADTVCQGLTTQFTDYSVASDGIASWIWDFKDGTTSSIQNPVHTFSSAGVKNVKLIVTSNTGIKDSLEKNILVKQGPITEFSANTVCQGTETTLVNLTNTTGLNITSWIWDYGDGKGSTFQDPGSHGYLSAGDYQCTLIASADNGCSDTIVKSVTVGAFPVTMVTASTPLTFCSGESVTLSVGSNTDYSYQWMLNNTGITDATSNNYTAEITGTFSVKVTNIKGNCIDTPSQVFVTRLDNPATPFIVTENYQEGECPGENPVVLSVDQPVTEYSYQWKRNGTPISFATNANHSGFLPEGDYSVIADLSGCKSESAVKTIVYDDAPAKPNISATGPTIWYLVCSNDTADQYRWYYNGTVIPGAERFLYIANRRLGKYNVSVGNEKGCFTMSDTLKIPTGLTGVEEIDPFEGLMIYPNPGPGMFTVEMDNNIFGVLDIRIFTGEGRQILDIKFEKTTEHFQSQIDLSGQGKGLYLINFLLEECFANRKIVIE